MPRDARYFANATCRRTRSAKLRMNVARVRIVCFSDGVAATCGVG